MKININTLVILFLYVSVMLVSAQTKTYKWETEFCGFEATYDSSKYTETQLTNTRELMDSLGAVPLMTNTTAWKYEIIETLKVEDLDKEYREKSAELKNLDIVKDEYWQTIKQNKIKEMDQSYRLMRLQIQGYTNPVILREYKSAETCTVNYAEPLIAGGDTLINAWIKLNREVMQKDNQTQVRRFARENASPDRLKYAQLDVMSYGWWNCVNKTIEYVTDDEKHRENFARLFVSVKELYCDEPE
jgi:hypothetical protein